MKGRHASRLWLCALYLSHGNVACSSDETTANATMFGAPAATTPTDIGRVGDGALDAQLEAIRGKYRLPALIGVSFGADTVHEVGVTGVRALGRAELATVDDSWHIGSLTKSMTAVLAAMLVERGHIAWTTTIAESFPDLTPSALEVYGSIRLEELLTHTGMITENRTAAPSWASLRDSKKDIRAQRRQLVTEYLALPPQAERGSFSYSSAGYVVAGAMLEAAANASWEDLMQLLLFEPLGLTSSGFGAPGSSNRCDQPWGHVEREGGFLSLPPSPNADDPLAMGPAGTVHAPIADLIRYFRLHLDPARFGAALLSAESLTRLHTPAPGTKSASGWGAPNPGSLTHAGSNNAWFAYAYLDQNRKLGAFSCTNAGGSEADAATFATIQVLLDRARDAL